jgi:hypothetical protein
MDDSLLFDTQLRGGGAFTVPEGDESADDGFDVEAPSAAAAGHGLYAPQRPGVPTQRGAAPTRQRTPTTRHAPPPTMVMATMQPGSVVGRRVAPPGAFVAASAAKSGNASSAALMPPPPPRGNVRSLPPATPFAAQGAPAAAVAPVSTQFRCAFAGLPCATAVAAVRA